MTKIDRREIQRRERLKDRRAARAALINRQNETAVKLERVEAEIAELEGR